MQAYTFYPALPIEAITDIAGGNGPLFPKVSGAPISEWAQQAAVYARAHYYYSGQFLGETIDEGTATQDRSNMKFPVEMNLFEAFCDMHGLLVWGAKPHEELINFYLKRRNNFKMEYVDEDDALNAFEIVLDMNRRKRLLRNASIIMQVFGGFFYRVAIDKENPIGVTLMTLPPNIVYPVFDINGRIIQLWVSYYINGAQAKALGYNGEVGDDMLTYVEYWDEYEWQLWVNEQKLGSGKNVYIAEGEERAHVPFVYVPRRRVIGNYGKSLVDIMIGVTRELNSRAADYGDTIADASKPVRYGKNLRGQEINVNDYRNGEIINLGDTFSDMPEPELDQLASPTLPSDASDYIDWLKNIGMLLSFTSPVIFGIDEGSQRSAETLSARALPSIVSVNDYREAMADGLNRVAQLVWRALRWSSEVEFSKPYDDLKRYKVIIQFAPILAKDRTSLVTEETTLVGAGVRSKKKAIENLGDVYNIEEEIKDIFGDMEKSLQLEKKYQPQPTSPFGNGASSSQSSTGAKKNVNASSSSGPKQQSGDSTTNRARAAQAKATSSSSRSKSKK